jgi:hypothetical protein
MKTYVVVCFNGLFPTAVYPTRESHASLMHVVLEQSVGARNRVGIKLSYTVRQVTKAP